MYSTDAFLKQLDALIQEKHLLKHTFYQAWSEGKLDKECLKDYAIEYYHHVKAFPTYLSALHAHTEHLPTRKNLLRNLIEEEDGEPNHPDLWKSFALSLGATEEEIAQHQPCAAIQTLIQTFRSICREGSVSEGLASLYAYESQIPAICLSKIDGLKKHYGLTDAKSWRYFTVHIAADEEHARLERELLAQHIAANKSEKTQRAAQDIVDALWNFLTHMTHKYSIAC